MAKYFDYSMCKLCGGQCCKGYAGTYVPDDFKQPITADFILSLLDSGKFAIDWWEGDAKGGDLSVTYYLRPRHKNEAAVKGSWGGECVNWTKESGCSLQESERPHGCRKLIPKYVNGQPECYTLKEDKADKQGGAIAWYEYQNILNEVTERYYETVR